jgi:site-specific recombinase XerD
MASIRLILRTAHVDQSGHSPLYIRLTKDRRTSYLSAGVKLKGSEWNGAKQKVTKKHPNSVKINASLSQKIADAEGQIADMERKIKTVSITKLKEAIKGKGVTDFFEYAYAHCEKMKGNVSYGTYRTYNVNIRKFETYLGKGEIYFDEITVTLLKDYMTFMGNQLNNGHTTQRYSVMILAIIFKEAIKEDIIPQYLYPFNKLTFKRNTQKRFFLTKEQINALTLLDLKQAKRADLWRDLFLFSTYAGGLRFSDVIELQYGNYNPDEQRIKKVIRKTGRLHQFKMGKVALDILNKYAKANAKHDDYIFPIITDKKVYSTNEETRYNIASKENHNANFQLNRMGRMLKLPFSLSFHLSRHSFATNALNNGMRIEHVSKLMDHQDIRTTQIYAKIINEELDKAVENYIY